MNKFTIKLLLWTFLVLLFLALSLGAMRGISGLVAYFQQGADPASALNIVPNVPPDLKVNIGWLPDDPDTGREMEPLTRRLIESAYLRAWLQWNISYQKGEPHGLRTYFVDSALTAVEDAVRKPTAQGWQLSQVNTEHILKLHLYSADGSIVSFTDHAANLIQVVRDEAGQELYADEIIAQYDVVMFLEDGNWRVRHWVRRAINDPSDPATEMILQEYLAAVTDEDETQSTLLLPSTEPLESGVLLTQTVAINEINEAIDDEIGDEVAFTLAGRPFQIKGINYYPQETPWHQFWENYLLADEVDALEEAYWHEATTDADDEEKMARRRQEFEMQREEILVQAARTQALIERELRQIHDLGLNTIRIFIPFEQFGGANVKPHMQNRLTDLLDKAQLYDLKVIVTLFDLRSDYNLLLWPQADHHLKRLLIPLAHHPAILAWDLKNTPDLDYESAGQKTVNSWLRHVARLAHRYDPNHLVTVGWSSPEAAQTEIKGVDFTSFLPELDDELTPMGQPK